MKAGGRSAQSAAATQNRFGAIVRRALPHDMLNVHFDGVFREVEPRRDQLVGKTEF